MSALAFDLTRLIGRGRFPTPTGIDRFELHYARWIRSRRHAEDLFIETTNHGPAVVKRERADQIIDDARKRWTDRAMSLEHAALLDAVLAAIKGQRPPGVVRGTTHNARIVRAERTFSRVVGAVRAFVTPTTPVPTDASLLHVSHARLDRPEAFAWLDDGATRRGIFYVHDLIPLSHPEFVRAREPARHARRMETVLRFGRVAICNTRTTAAALCDFALARGASPPRIAVLPPGVDEAFLRSSPNAVAAAARPYFVCIGTIEPRKNHLLLLNIWRRLRDRDGALAPRLVIVGRRGWDNAELFKRLDRSELPQGSVIEVSDLADAALAPLLAGAAALLAPSFTEGYGMPVAEALAVGTPVIASDIAAHREVAGDAATLIDPLDGPAWIAAIDAHAAMRRRVPARQRVSRSWADHFRMVEGLLAGTHRDLWTLEPTANVVPLFAAPRDRCALAHPRLKL